MKFLDYEKIIRDNYPVLIESYVKQYGEEYREHITSTLEHLKFCFFVTPYNIVEYVKKKQIEDYLKAILDSFEELGLDISNINLTEDCLEVANEQAKKLINIYFPDLSLEKGIFSFKSEYDLLDWDNPIIIERLRVLEAINKKSKDISDKDYIKSYEYQSNCLLMQKELEIFERNFDKWCQDYDEILNYAFELNESILQLGRNLEKEYLIEIKEYLSKKDQDLINSGKDFEVSDLEGYKIYFDLELLDESDCFSDGPIDYFNQEYTNKLLDGKISSEEKEKILNMRLQYLERIGFDINSLEGKDLYCDWNQLDYLKNYLPNKDYLQMISALKQEKIDLFKYECAKLCIINGYELNKNYDQK